MPQNSSRVYILQISMHPFLCKKTSAGWVDGWIGGWMKLKAGLRIAYSNKKYQMIQNKSNIIMLFKKHSLFFINALLFENQHSECCCMTQHIIEYFETFEIDNTEQKKIKKQQTSSVSLFCFKLLLLS